MKGLPVHGPQRCDHGSVFLDLRHSFGPEDVYARLRQEPLENPFGMARLELETRRLVTSLDADGVEDLSGEPAERPAVEDVGTAQTARHHSAYMTLAPAADDRRRTAASLKRERAHDRSRRGAVEDRVVELARTVGAIGSAQTLEIRE